ncbi:transposase IS116/IS110/IS902 family protein [Hydrogenispora ethanolica]|uniref:Transposase IS116/IS110/IS902 family protein n=1 Tax=Hydrogenispora ethanolica TaxID=1082276 RepID=A0A4R1QN63_HYDET|nr:transposase [Hydrogenispora ethanolica]TCL55136.1 transposase IS116/IS110/IS902 family protein [Hydrogenispora ethanolica]
MDHIARYNPEQEEIVFGMEATGHYWLALYSHLVSEGYTVHVINPIQSDSLRSMYIRQAKTDAVDAFIIAEVIRFGRFSETTLSEPDIVALRQLCWFRFSMVDHPSDLKRQVITALDLIFPEYETIFSDMFGRSSKELLAEFTTPEEILAIDTEKLAQLLSTTSRGRFGRCKAEEIQAKARQSFGIKHGTEAIAFQIRQLVAQIQFLEKQLAELETKIGSYYERFSCPVHTTPGVGPTLGATILGEIGDINRFSSPAKTGCVCRN